MLADVLVGESPTGGAFPVAAVAISADGKDDQSIESADEKVLVGWVGPGPIRQEGERTSRPQRRSWTISEPGNPEINDRLKRMAEFECAEPC